MSFIFNAPAAKFHGILPDEIVTGEPAIEGMLAWYDPSDLSTMFQNANFTNPVTASGQNVRSMLDKSGNGNHLVTTFGSNLTYVESGGLHYLQYVTTNLQCNTFVGASEIEKVSFYGVFATNGYSNSVIMSLRNSTITQSAIQFQIYSNNLRNYINPTNQILHPAVPALAGSPYLVHVGFDGLKSGTQKSRIHINRLFRPATPVVGVPVLEVTPADTSNLNLLSFSTSTGGTAAGKFYGGLFYSEILAGSELSTVEDLLCAKADLPVFSPFSPVAAPMWQLLVTLNNGHTNTCIAEFQLLDANDNPISLSDAIITASSIYSASFPAAYGTDELVDVTHRWATANTVADKYPCYLRIEKPSPITPYSYVIYPHHSYPAGGDSPRDFQLQYSLDGGDTWVNHGPAQVGVIGWTQFVGVKFPIVYPYMINSGYTPDSNIFNRNDKDYTVFLAQDNKTVSKANSGWATARGIKAVSAGKKYFEVTVDAVPMIIGVTDADFELGLAYYLGQNTASAKKSAGLQNTGNVYRNLTNAYSTAAASSFAAGAVIGVLLDFDTFTISWYNGVTGALIHSYVDAAPWGEFFPAVSMNSSGKGTLNASGPFDHLPAGAAAWDSPFVSEPAADWSILITANNGWSDVAVAELIFLDINGDPISTAGGTAIYSSQYSVAYPATYAFDNNAATAWASAANSFISGVGSQWIGMRFPTPVGVYGVRIKAQSSGDLSDQVKDFQVRRSEDAGLNWENVSAPIIDQTGWAFSEERTFNFI